MCTAIAFNQKSKFLLRTLDLEYSFGEQVVVCGREVKINLRHEKPLREHCAIIGMGIVKDCYPLYYDAINEYGLGVAGLNFVGNAEFCKMSEEKVNLAQFELIPYLLAKCKNTRDAIRALKEINLVNTPFDKSTPVSELHYLITDGKSTVTAEPTVSGFNIYDNPFGLLTNNPPFPFQVNNVNNYLNLTTEEPKNRFSTKVNLTKFSRGMGAIGLPGDNSSSSRFVRALFTSKNAEIKLSESEEISQAFHVIESVFQIEGTVRLDSGLEKTQYTAVANLNTGTYYYKTYDNSRIRAVSFSEDERARSQIQGYPIYSSEDILYVNKEARYKTN